LELQPASATAATKMMMSVRIAVPSLMWVRRKHLLPFLNGN
jgi:hypothetical protein